MARKPSSRAASKAATQSADPAAASAAPAAAEQLASQPAAPTANAAPAQATEPASTEQPANEASVLENGSMGQDAPTDTAPAAPDTAAATSQPASAAPQAPVGDVAGVGGDLLDDDGDIDGLWITAIPEQGFRRCGYRFTREGFGIALDALTAEQIEQLESEPNLRVERGIFSGRVE